MYIWEMERLWLFRDHCFIIDICKIRLQSRLVNYLGLSDHNR